MESETWVIAKVVAWASYSTVGTLVAAAGEVPIIIGVLTSVMAFAGMLIRQTIVGQRELMRIIDQKEKDNLTLRRENHYTKWERERARWRANERSDPGPYEPLPEWKVDLEKEPA